MSTPLDDPAGGQQDPDALTRRYHERRPADDCGPNCEGISLVFLLVILLPVLGYLLFN